MVSATQLSSYMYCPRKLFIGYVLKIKEPPKKELVKGKIWHQTHEMINKAEENVVKSITSDKYTDIFDLYRRSFAKFLRNSIIMNKKELSDFNIKLIDIFKEYWTDFEEEAKLRALNVAEFIKKHKVFGQELWEKLTPKIISEQYVKSDKLDISGIIDMIEVYDEVHIPVELKTGKVPAKGMWDTHRIQLAAYLMILEDTGKKVSEGVLRYKGSEDKRILIMNTMLKEEVTDIVKKAQSILKSFDPPKHTDNKNKCTKCSYKEICYDDEEMKRLIKEKTIKK